MVCGVVCGQEGQVENSPIYYKDGNVGIDNGSPEYKLDVFGSARVSGYFFGQRLYLSNYHFSYDQGGLAFAETHKANRLFIKDGGNVGIGTITPNKKLSIEGSSQSDIGLSLLNNSNSLLMYLLGTNDQYIVEDQRNAGLLESNSDLILSAAVNSNNTSPSIIFQTGRTYKQGHTRMIIDYLGNVAIGKPSADAKLDVAGDIKANGNLIFKRDSEIQITPFFGGGNTPSRTHTIIKNGWKYNMDYTSLHAAGMKANTDAFILINSGGRVGIGTDNPKAKLDVAGNIKAHEIEVTLASIDDMQLNGTLAANNITYTANGNTADFVFEDNYQLKDLSEVDAFIKANKHLPEIPSAAEMEESGVNLAEMNKLLLMKVEELTLYSIEQEKKIEKLTEDRRQETEENNEKVKSLEFKVEELSDERRAIRGEMEKVVEDGRRVTELEERLVKLEALMEELTLNP